MRNATGNSNFPVLLLIAVLILTIGISGIMVLLNRTDPAMQTASGPAATVEPETIPDAPEEVTEDVASLDVSVVTPIDGSAPVAVSGEEGPVTAARSSTSTMVQGQLPRSLPVDGEEMPSDIAAQESSRTEGVSLLAQRDRTDRGVRHLCGVTNMPPDTGVTYEEIWAQFVRDGDATRYDEAYNETESECNAIVDQIYIEMTRLRAGNGSEEALLDMISDLEAIDITSFGSSDKLIVKRSAYFLDWQNVCVAKYALDFARGYEEGDADTMRTALDRTSEVYRQMAYETDFRYQIVNSY